MIIPSIDLQNGSTVQLVGGESKALDAGDPRPIAREFGRVGEIAVIDLDAALGTGSNETLIRELLALAPCRVGGGIRDVETAVRWLDAGATRVILGTAARPEILSQLPKDRVIAALDAKHDEVVVEGWQKATGRNVVDRIHELRDYVGGFLVTFVEHEGRLHGVDPDRVRPLVEAAGDARLTVAGGVRDAAEIATLDALGADAQVGMAIYTKRFELADAVWSVLRSERDDGLVPTIVTDRDGLALGLAWSDRDSLHGSLSTGRGFYHSRRRGLWEKGSTSGDTQELVRVDVDCDRDALRFVVQQHGRGFCHRGTWSCFGEANPGLRFLERTIGQRAQNAPEGSYTRRLFDDPDLLRAKLVEEANELAAADTPSEVRHEAADVLYFTMVAMARAGVSLADVAEELTRRDRAVTRRPGNAKPEASE